MLALSTGTTSLAAFATSFEVGISCPNDVPRRDRGLLVESAGKVTSTPCQHPCQPVVVNTKSCTSWYGECTIIIHYSQDLIHLRWCKISSINSVTCYILLLLIAYMSVSNFVLARQGICRPIRWQRRPPRRCHWRFFLHGTVVAGGFGIVFDMRE